VGYVLSLVGIEIGGVSAIADLVAWFGFVIVGYFQCSNWHPGSFAEYVNRSNQPLKRNFIKIRCTARTPLRTAASSVGG
jgi:hypothetical protein